MGWLRCYSETMRGKKLGIMGTLLFAGLLIADDVRGWIVGKMLESISPAGGWSLQGVLEWPWGNIIGIPMSVYAAGWLLWESFGRTSFRARFGSERLISEQMQPVQQGLLDLQRQIENIFSALSAIKDRESIQDSQRELQAAAEFIWRLAEDSGPLNDAQAFTLTGFIDDWSNELWVWKSIAGRYDPEIERKLEAVDPTRTYDVSTANISDSRGAQAYWDYHRCWVNWEAERDAVWSMIEKVAFGGIAADRQTAATVAATP